MSRERRLKPVAARRAEKRRSAVSACPSGKRQHRSKAAALRFAREFGSKAPQDKGVRYAYLCGACESWHLTKLRPAA